MLLKSWATPPASLPTDSIFCDCASSACSFSRSASASLRSVMSRMMPCQSVPPFAVLSGNASDQRHLSPWRGRITRNSHWKISRVRADSTIRLLTSSVSSGWSRPNTGEASSLTSSGVTS